MTSKAVIAVLGAVVMAMASPAVAKSDERVTTNVMVPFESVVESTFENIAVTGTVHVVTHVLIGEDSTLVEVHTNFLNTTGIGLSTGATFRGFGQPMSITQLLPLGEASLEFIIATAGAVLKGDVQKDITLLSNLLLSLKFDVFGRVVGASVEPFLHCIDC